MYVVNSNGTMTFSPVPGVMSLNAYALSDEKLREVLRRRDTIVLFEGGADIATTLYGQPNRHAQWPSVARDTYEVALYDLAVEYDVPMLGICRGHQLIAAKKGGTLYQDIRTELGKGHSWEHDIVHTSVSLETGFYELMKSNPRGSPVMLQSVHNITMYRSKVNSMHHQAVNNIPSDARVLAYADDGTPEALIYPRALTVQWHPECMGHTEFLRFMESTFLKGEAYAHQS